MEKNMPKAEKLNIWPKLNTNPKSTKINDIFWKIKLQLNDIRPKDPFL